jgi:sugar phosphate permease
MKSIHYAWVILVVATIVVSGALGLARFGYTAVLPEMQKGLGLDNTQAGVIASSNLFGYLLLAVTGGAMAARFGPRLVISVGMAVVGIGMLLTGAADGFSGAMFWRGLTGIGSGASNVPVMALLSAWFAPRRRGLAAGIGVAGSSVALIVVGPTVPRVLTLFGENGWRATWVIFGLAGLAIAVLAAFMLRNRPSELGLSPLGAPADEPRPALHRGPVEWSRVYKSAIVWRTGVVYMAFGFSYIIYMTFFKKYLVAEAGYSQGAAGNLFMLMGWFSLLCGLIWGHVSDIAGRRAALIIVYVIQAAAFVLFAFKASAAAMIMSAVLFGLTAWSIPAIMAAFCGDLLGPRLAPAALGFVTLFFGVGQALGPSVAGMIADRTDSFAPAFVMAAVVAFLGAMGSARLNARSDNGTHGL